MSVVNALKDVAERAGDDAWFAIRPQLTSTYSTSHIRGIPKPFHGVSLSRSCLSVCKHGAVVSLGEGDGIRVVVEGEERGARRGGGGEEEEEEEKRRRRRRGGGGEEEEEKKRRRRRRGGGEEEEEEEEKEILVHLIVINWSIAHLHNRIDDRSCRGLEQKLLIRRMIIHLRVVKYLDRMRAQQLDRR
eukprot:758178-Hanusia_phi.AAC.4